MWCRLSVDTATEMDGYFYGTCQQTSVFFVHSVRAFIKASSVWCPLKAATLFKYVWTFSGHQALHGWKRFPTPAPPLKNL